MGRGEEGGDFLFVRAAWLEKEQHMKAEEALCVKDRVRVRWTVLSAEM